MIDSETTERYELPAVVFQAEGTLSVLLDVPIERAVLALAQWAELGQLTLAEAARVILHDSTWDQASPTTNDEFLAIVRRL